MSKIFISQNAKIITAKQHYIKLSYSVDYGYAHGRISICDEKGNETEEKATQEIVIDCIYYDNHFPQGEATQFILYPGASTEISSWSYPCSNINDINFYGYDNVNIIAGDVLNIFYKQYTEPTGYGTLRLQNLAFSGSTTIKSLEISSSTVTTPVLLLHIDYMPGELSINIENANPLKIHFTTYKTLNTTITIRAKSSSASSYINYIGTLIAADKASIIEGGRVTVKMSAV